MSAGMSTNVGLSAQVSSFDRQAHREALVKYIVGADMPTSLREPCPHLNMLELYIQITNPSLRN